jgi:LAS superfamily LD-carboxypeptidase LdcB
MAAKKATLKKTTPKKTTPKKKTPMKKKATTRKKATQRAAGRASVSSEKHELAYISKKHGVEEAVVKRIIKDVGNKRVDVEAGLEEFKMRSAAADKSLVSYEAHEVAVLARKFDLSKDVVETANSKHGASRKKIEADLAKG